MSLVRTRWAAIGAAVAVTLGAGGLGLVSATGPSGAVTLVPITPCRLIDTRAGTDNVGPFETALGAGQTITVSAHGDNGRCTGIPTGATGLSLNVTAVGATQPSFFTIWPTGATQPNSSSINPVPGEPPTPNAVTTKLSVGGQFDIFNLAGQVDVIVDVNGYYVDHDHDDRYYSKAESDARYAPADAPVTSPLSFHPLDFRSGSSGSGWTFDIFLSHTTGVYGCAYVPLELPVGAIPQSVFVDYNTPGPGAKLQVLVSNFRRGMDGSEGGQQVFSPDTTLPNTFPGHATTTLALGGTPTAVSADREYSLRLCATNTITISDVKLNFTT